MSCQKLVRSVACKKSKCSDDQFEEWKIEHVAVNECGTNFDGSSPAVEAEAAVILWNRSIERRNIRYRWIICDGDSKAFNSVENKYNGCQVEKQDCVGHVQKRMGKHLL